MRKLLVSLTLLSPLLWWTPAQAQEAQPFVTAKEVDLLQYLPSPPAADSAQTQAELQELLQIQKQRTPEQAAAAKADSEENVWRFADVMGPNFKADQLPKLAAFYDRIVATEGAVVDPAKDVWKRARPFMLSKELQPVVKLSKSGSWPSGHSTLGYLIATTLGDIAPEKRDALFTRAAQYAEHRLIGGVHYRSDTVMSRTAAALIVQKMKSLPEYQQAFAAAKAEWQAQVK